MPWKPEDAKKHSKKAKPKQWAAVANKVLEKTGDEGRAVRTANAVAKPKKKR